MGMKWLFFLNPVPWPSALRIAFLRIFGPKMGRRVLIWSKGWTIRLSFMDGISYHLSPIGELAGCASVVPVGAPGRE